MCTRGYGPGLRPATHPQCYPPTAPWNHPHGNHLPPSAKISCQTYMLASCLLCATKIGCSLRCRLKKIPNGVFPTCSCPQSTLMVTLYGLLSKSHVPYITAGHALPIHYLHDTSKTPHPSHRGRGGKLHPARRYLQCITANEVPLREPYAR